MRSRKVPRAALAAAGAALALGISAVPAEAGRKPSPPPPTSGTPTTYSGQAEVVDVKGGILSVLGGDPQAIDLNISDTGPLPSTGGILTTSLLTIPDPPPDQLLLFANVASAATVGSGNQSSSYASVADLGLGLGPVQPDTLQVGASVLQSQAKAECVNGQPVLTGSSYIANLYIKAGALEIPVPVAAPPNTKITVPGVAEITLNEQVRTANAIDVTALRVRTLSPLSGLVNLDIRIARTHADITCAGGENPPPPNCSAKDFVTGGGQVLLSDGSRMTFGGVAGTKKDGTYFGHVNVIDRGTDRHMKFDQVVAYGDPAPPSTTRQAALTGTTNGAPSSGLGTWTDNGEPGTNDAFSIASGGSTRGGTLLHGNVQLHQPKGCETTTTPTKPGKGGGR